MSRAARKPVAFLDRDGVVVEERGYVRTRDELRVLPGAARAVRELNGRGYEVALISNQSAVARGFVTLDGLAAMNAWLVDQLEAEGGRIGGVYVCPHHPEGAVEQYRCSCDCRKPAPGLLQRAAVELGLILDVRSLLAGDQLTDLVCAQRAGVRPVLVRTGKGASVEEQARREIADLLVVDSVADLPPALPVAGDRKGQQ